MRHPPCGTWLQIQLVVGLKVESKMSFPAIFSRKTIAVRHMSRWQVAGRTKPGRFITSSFWSDVLESFFDSEDSYWCSKNGSSSIQARTHRFFQDTIEGIECCTNLLCAGQPAIRNADSA